MQRYNNSYSSAYTRNLSVSVNNKYYEPRQSHLMRPLTAIKEKLPDLSERKFVGIPARMNTELSQSPPSMLTVYIKQGVNADIEMGMRKEVTNAKHFVPIVDTKMKYDSPAKYGDGDIYEKERIQNLSQPFQSAYSFEGKRTHCIHTNYQNHLGSNVGYVNYSAFTGNNYETQWTTGASFYDYDKAKAWGLTTPTYYKFDNFKSEAFKVNSVYSDGNN